ncbi:hypothetical protein ACFVUH_16005 [Kitasatospora sp. NPDC058032]|uniref:hypothetical protein n=1 Tax=Kitasatospora sp. NPDC058032 TaxID=3346307 RepID=UPI0036D7DA31
MATINLVRGMGSFFKEYKIRCRNAADRQTEESGFTTQDRSSRPSHSGGTRHIPELLNSAAAQRSPAHSNPLVFLDACRSSGASPGFTRMTGWAQQFLAAGAGTFIDTLRAVRSDKATSWLRHRILLARITNGYPPITGQSCSKYRP